MGSNGRFSQVQAPIRMVHSNLDQEIIQITEDKLRLVLKEHIELVERRKEWIAPLGVLMAVVTAFVTSTFRDAYLKAATWEAVFLVTGVLSAAWLVRSIRLAFLSPSADDLVQKIKNKSEE